MKIGSLRLQNNLVLAPMVRVSDPPFRLLCREQGASLAFSEMIYAKAIIHKASAILAMATPLPKDRPFGVQLAGFDSQELQEATAIVSETADLVDLNLGCPVPKAGRSGVGAVLLKKPEKIGELVKAMRKATDKPLTAKMRLLGTVQESVELAQIIENAGADAITVHGRTKEQKRAGFVDLGAIQQIKESLSIPVINNGGITGRESMLEIRKKTNCDGFMLARSAIGNPGIFAELLGKKGISKEEALKRYLELCEETHFASFGRIKQQALRFCHALKNRELHQQIEKAKKLEEIHSLLSV